MAEFDEQLNSILSNPEAMSKIMQLAQSLGGGESAPKSEDPPHTPPAQEQPSHIQPPTPGEKDILSSLAGSLDPALLTRLLPLAAELGGNRNNSARQLLFALRPYLKPERQEKIERALQLARLFHVGRKFLKEGGG